MPFDFQIDLNREVMRDLLQGARDLSVAYHLAALDALNRDVRRICQSLRDAYLGQAHQLTERLVGQGMQAPEPLETGYHPTV